MRRTRLSKKLSSLSRLVKAPENASKIPAAKFRPSTFPLLLPIIDHGFPLTKPIPKQPKMSPHDNRILDELLHTIDQAVPIRAGHQSRPALCAIVLRGEQSIRHRDGRLIRDSKHAHPPPQHPQTIHRIERLRPTTHHRDPQCASLRRPHRPRAQRDPVDLVLEDRGQVAVLFGRHPEVSVAPAA